MTRRLLVIISDRLSTLVHKGEVTQRYYNPGNVFEEVHILEINDDRPEAAAVQPMVGDATLDLTNNEIVDLFQMLFEKVGMEMGERSNI